MRTPDPAADLVPLHPEPVADDARSMRWVTPVGVLGFVGPAASLPGPVQALLDDGTLDLLEVEPAAVRTRVGPGHSWAQAGARVRSALQAGLAEPGSWVPPAGSSPDDALRMAAEQVIAGDVGAYVRSHGGAVELVGVRDGTVEVRMSGACTHCPAADLTLTQRFEVALRTLHPQVVGVTAHPGPGSGPGSTGLAGGRRLLGVNPLRRR